VHGLVNSTQDFDGQALVMNGASDFLVEVFGEAGKHIRTAVGVANLPMGFSASVYIIAEVE
jgi:enamine deaminase RidA (YjgF/YER057c/UK114 family)